MISLRMIWLWCGVLPGDGSVMDIVASSDFSILILLCQGLQKTLGSDGLGRSWSVFKGKRKTLYILFCTWRVPPLPAGDQHRQSLSPMMDPILQGPGPPAAGGELHYSPVLPVNRVNLARNFIMEIWFFLGRLKKKNLI